MPAGAKRNRPNDSDDVKQECKFNQSRWPVPVTPAAGGRTLAPPRSSPPLPSPPSPHSRARNGPREEKKNGRAAGANVDRAVGPTPPAGRRLCACRRGGGWDRRRRCRRTTGIRPRSPLRVLLLLLHRALFRRRGRADDDVRTTGDRDDGPGAAGCRDAAPGAVRAIWRGALDTDEGAAAGGSQGQNEEVAGDGGALRRVHEAETECQFCRRRPRTGPAHRPALLFRRANQEQEFARLPAHKGARHLDGCAEDRGRHRRACQGATGSASETMRGGRRG
ncbi:MAG: hypothetical protein BJ554DRAFT_876 [Olpidium bornovanus]|uniref:Uncharacterized protein n=1 Tax=Olpidium bornovanus TaxID=278681 RepID=A0A8H8DHV8_9FUNG|nr:MAG: hypothetical protein BJ554DRAFT_876 [Olpidium bornovanus]